MSHAVATPAPSVFRALAVLAVAVAVGLAWFVARGAGVDGVGLARFLLDHGAATYAVGLGWVLVAPLVLVAALVAQRRTPWPWVGAVTLHLAVLLALSLRLRHLVPGAAAGVLACYTVLCLASVLVAVADR